MVRGGGVKAGLFELHAGEKIKKRDVSLGRMLFVELLQVNAERTVRISPMKAWLHHWVGGRMRN